MLNSEKIYMDLDAYHPENLFDCLLTNGLTKIHPNL